MVGHLPEPSTQAILFAPIKATVLEALGQLQTALNAHELGAAASGGKALVAPERLEALATSLEALGAAPAASATVHRPRSE